MKTLFFLLIPLFTFSQVKMPSIPQPTQFQHYENQGLGNPNNINAVPNPMNIFNGTDETQKRQQLQNEKLIREVNQTEKQKEIQMREIYADINRAKSNINSNLPSYSNLLGTNYY